MWVILLSWLCALLFSTADPVSVYYLFSKREESITEVCRLPCPWKLRSIPRISPLRACDNLEPPCRRPPPGSCPHPRQDSTTRRFLQTSLLVEAPVGLGLTPRGRGLCAGVPSRATQPPVPPFPSFYPWSLFLFCSFSGASEAGRPLARDTTAQSQLGQPRPAPGPSRCSFQKAWSA